MRVLTNSSIGGIAGLARRLTFVMESSPAPVAYLALIVATAIWGLNSHAVTIATQSLTPAAFLLLRFFIAAIVMFILINLRKPQSLAVDAKARDIVLHEYVGSAAMAAALLGLAYALQIQGLTKGDSVVTVFLSSTSVLWVPLIVWIVSKGQEQIPNRNRIGVVLSCLGIAISQGFKWSNVTQEAVFAFVASLAFAGEMVLVTRVSSRLNPKALAWWMLIKIAAVASGCFMVWTFMGAPLEQTAVPKSGMPLGYIHPAWWIGSLVFSSIFATTIALYVSAWSTSVKLHTGKTAISATSRGIIENLDAPFTMVFGLLLFPWNVQLSWWSGGLLLVFAGVLWSEWPRKPNE